MILCIETATSVCSVALCDREKVIAVAEAQEGTSHASMLTVLAGRLLSEAGITPSSLEAVAVSKGPGSYTGLRIGVSVAKGIAWGSGIPLIAVNTLRAMCYGLLASQGELAEEETLLCPMIDARRMEVYNALYRHDMSELRGTAADIIGPDSFSSELAGNRIIFFGNGAEKCAGVIDSGNAVFVKGFRLSASYLQIPSLEALRKKNFEDAAYFEPYYLKEFIATVPGRLIP